MITAATPKIATNANIIGKISLGGCDGGGVVVGVVVVGVVDSGSQVKFELQ